MNTVKVTYRISIFPISLNLFKKGIELGRSMPSLFLHICVLEVQFFRFSILINFILIYDS